MRVHVISDMEGISGIVNSSQTNGGEPLYEEGRRLYTEEINAAVRGAGRPVRRGSSSWTATAQAAVGASTRSSRRRSIPGEWVVQEEWTGYTEFLEAGCDPALFVGMHARAGTRTGVLNHTVSGSEWQNLWFNGKLVGETAINAALCGTWGCPALLVTGDEAACAEARELLGGGLETVAVKRGLGLRTARMIPPPRARGMIEAGARRGLADLGAVAPYDPGRPCEITVE